MPAATPDLKTHLDVDEMAGSFSSPLTGSVRTMGIANSVLYIRALMRREPEEFVPGHTATSENAISSPQGAPSHLGIAVAVRDC